MITSRRAVGLGLTVALFFCFAVSSHSPTLAQGGEKKHPVMHKALHDLRDAHKKMKALKPHYNGHREKALEHIDKPSMRSTRPSSSSMVRARNSLREAALTLMASLMSGNREPFAL